MTDHHPTAPDPERLAPVADTELPTTPDPEKLAPVADTDHHPTTPDLEKLAPVTVTHRATAPDLEKLAPLADKVRRRLYEHVVAQGAPVDRDAAAGALGIGRPLAAFHLDRLAEAGLLDVE